MKKLIITGFFTLLTASSAWSEVIIDVFGVDAGIAEKIKQRYASAIQALEIVKNKDLYKSYKEPIHNEKLQELAEQQKKLTTTIKDQYNLAFVDLQSVQYPLDKNIYTTIEVIKKEEPERLKYVEQAKKQTYPQKNDIIQKMLEFQTIAIDIAMHEKNPDTSCPVNHCIASFKHPALNPYLEMFNNAIKKDKKLIINTLNNDPNPERRGAAIFLIGHMQNPNKVIKILLPHINNANMLVRNNSMRVIGATIEKNKRLKVNAEPFIKQLDSPYLTDRNKALYVLSGLIEQEQAKKQLLRTGKERLVRVLRLTQPNNHEYAYRILKSISNQDFGEKNYTGWEKWAKEDSSAKKLLKT